MRSIQRLTAGAAGRILLWILASLATSTLLYWNHTVILLQRISEIVPGEAPVYPIAGIFFISVFILFRYGEIRESLEKEVKLKLEPKIRLAGLLLTLTPAATVYTNLHIDMDVSATILALVWFGVFTSINPYTSRILMPYTGLYVATTLLPRIIYPLAGEALADLASILVGHAAKMLGIPAPRGRSLEFTSLNGETLGFTISSACSSISSITVFLLLCGLMHLDLKKPPSATILLAVTGTAALTLLNALRIVILVWVGYAGGDWSMWGVHRWLGYVLFIGFYTLAAKIYMGGLPSWPLNVKGLRHLEG